MALEVNGSRAIFKKCDRSNHKPAYNQRCAAVTRPSSKRVDFGSGKKLAED